jgi:lipopolysaccharide export LptBFGC system permease protein LptF
MEYNAGILSQIHKTNYLVLHEYIKYFKLPIIVLSSVNSIFSVQMLNLLALNLALMAIPLGAVNPRIGRSGDLLIAGLVAMLYMNLINITQGWIIHGKLRFVIGVWLIHAIFATFTVVLLWHRLRVKEPKPPVVKPA